MHDESYFLCSSLGVRADCALTRTSDSSYEVISREAASGTIKGLAYCDVQVIGGRKVQVIGHYCIPQHVDRNFYVCAGHHGIRSAVIGRYSRFGLSIA